MIGALIFDVDGTLADTEEIHRQAFNAAFSDRGLDWHWDVARYSKLLDITGGKERLHGHWQDVDPIAAAAPGASATIEELHALKTRHYERLLRDRGLTLRPGIERLIGAARSAGVRLAIATTTTPANVDALLRVPFGVRWREMFSAVEDAGTIAEKKPSPAVYRAVLGRLGLGAGECLAFEDSRNGLLAAYRAGIATIVAPTAFTAGQCFDEAILVLPDLGGLRLQFDARTPERAACC